MPTEDMLLIMIESFDNIAISISGISNIIAEYAESTNGDRLLIIMDRHCNGDTMYLTTGYGSARLIKRIINGATFINISYLFNGDLWMYPHGFEYLHPDRAMEQLSKHGISMFNEVHRAAMAIR
jgi:hypothetical protein